ncbi:MAG: hypothetical protein HYT65_00800 [Candidatus Yanofskybacteria bacterium]|nr:hypothetical protein [Candidatus Yanofskybacteria bacterium]
MRKRQTFMLLIAIWLALIIPACRQEIQPTPSVENPVIVDQPISDRTVYTNWEEVKLTYTVRWLDGYKLLYEMSEPENMSFGEFELDPIRGHELERQNRRRYKKENYEDLVYYLRHIDIKKGDMLIPEQEFQYVKEEAGRSKEDLEVYTVKAPGIMLRYDSVLTKNADDIIDRVDFGSFKEQENIMNGLIGVLFMIFGAAIFQLFWKPAVSTARKTSKTKTASASQIIDEQEERLAPKHALMFLNNKLAQLQANLAGESDNQKLRETRAAVCNELRRFFLSYVAELRDGEFTYDDIGSKISQISQKRKRELLFLLNNRLEHNENILYREETRSGLIDEITAMRKFAGELSDWRIWLFNKRQKWQGLNKWFNKFLRRAK